MSNISNKQVICDTLIEFGKEDKDIVVLVSDSRGSASMANFAKELPDQLVEIGIAEQNLVGVAAGLASAGKKPFIASPACFLAMRSIEQVKMDVAYSKNNVKIIGISGGVSYGALGLSHHSLQDIAYMRTLPGMTVILPADRIETRKMIEKLLTYPKCAYVRIGRNAVPDVYESEDYDFEIGKAVTMAEGNDITIIATGEMVSVAVNTAKELKNEGVSCRVLNMHTVKPIDEAAILKAAKETGHIITVEEHSIFGGLGSCVSEIVSQACPVPMKILGIPDEPAIGGNSKQVFDYYGLNVENVKKVAIDMLKK